MGTAVLGSCQVDRVGPTVPPCGRERRCSRREAGKGLGSLQRREVGHVPPGAPQQTRLCVTYSPPLAPGHPLTNGLEDWGATRGSPDTEPAVTEPACYRWLEIGIRQARWPLGLLPMGTQPTPRPEQKAEGPHTNPRPTCLLPRSPFRPPEPFHGGGGTHPQASLNPRGGGPGPHQGWARLAEHR